MGSPRRGGIPQGTAWHRQVVRRWGSLLFLWHLWKWISISTKHPNLSWTDWHIKHSITRCLTLLRMCVLNLENRENSTYRFMIILSEAWWDPRMIQLIDTNPLNCSSSPIVYISNSLSSLCTDGSISRLYTQMVGMGQFLWCILLNFDRFHSLMLIMVGDLPHIQ